MKMGEAGKAAEMAVQLLKLSGASTSDAAESAVRSSATAGALSAAVNGASGVDAKRVLKDLQRAAFECLGAATYAEMLERESSELDWRSQ
ncbi:MAG: hypothetical protein RL885_24890 [Planctomycetota bacterium]